MKKHKALFLSVLLGVLIILSLQSTAANALQSTAAVIEWWIMSSGGGPVTSSGGVAIQAAVGKPVVGSSSSESFSLQAGYSQPTWSLYLPMLRR